MTRTEKIEEIIKEQIEVELLIDQRLLESDLDWTQVLRVRKRIEVELLDSMSAPYEGDPR